MVATSGQAQHTPPGWAYNPSGWSQRLPLVGVALLGFGIASALALYQWGVLATIWEPFFGDGSAVVLNSPASCRSPTARSARSATCSIWSPVPSAGGRAGGRCRGS